MSVITTSLRNLSSFLQDHQVSFSNGLLILFTIGGEQIFRFNAFKCPCTQPDAYYYAIIFMLVPALILGILGVAVSNLTWRLLHGCLHRSEAAKNGISKTSGYLFIVVARAAVVPFAWLFIALLDGNYYACMLATNPCEKQSSGNESEEIVKLKADSQIIAWIYLGSLIMISFMVICFARCCDSVTYVQYKYLNSYREAEQEEIEKQIQKRTAEMAVSNVDAFITKEQLNKNDWDNISRVPDHILPKEGIEGQKSDPSKRFDVEHVPKVFLTPLHEWVNQRELKELIQVQQEITPV